MNLSFNGLGMHMGNLARLSNAETRSISAENFNGAKGAGGMAIDGTDGLLLVTLHADAGSADAEKLAVLMETADVPAPSTTDRARLRPAAGDVNPLDHGESAPVA